MLDTRITGFEGLAHGIQAGAAFVLGNREEALALLERAETAFDEQLMTQHAIVARIQRFRITGAKDQADALLDEIRALGAVRPEQLLLCYVPGFARVELP
jgi:hypothetical protein